ncbi:MAG: polysaccharide deacetylase family protein [Alphaproteobacteria bacterium]
MKKITPATMRFTDGPAINLVFHGVSGPQRKPNEDNENYFLSAEKFEKTISILAEIKRYAARAGKVTPFELTFDDGNLSDHAIAMPTLLRYGLVKETTFFILTGCFDTQINVSKDQVRDLARNGFEIGSHGITHINWQSATREVLKHELLESKRVLEEVLAAGQQITQRAVNTAALPYGLYNKETLELSRQCGYTRVYSIDGGPASGTLDPIPRYSLLEPYEPEALPEIIQTLGTPGKRVEQVKNVIAKGGSWSP